MLKKRQIGHGALMLAAVSAFVFSVVLTACTEEGEEETEFYEYTENGDGVTLYLKNYGVTEFAIPSEIGGKKVTKLARSSSDPRLYYTSITVPDSVTEIAEGTFYGCGSLESVSLPFLGQSLAAEKSSAMFGFLFGEESYAGGEATEQLYTIGSLYTFYIPSSLTSVTVRGGAISVGAFYGCSSIETAVLEGVTALGKNAFSHCTGLSAVTLSESLQELGDKAFYMCSSLNAIELPSSVTSIGEMAFGDCTALRTINIPAVSVIANYAFNNCASLQSVGIPEGVESIGYQAFNNCANLASVTIPSTMKYISFQAFNNCRRLTSAEFVTQSGWHVSSEGYDPEGKELSELGMSIASTAAVYLKGTYLNYFWIYAPQLSAEE